MFNWLYRAATAVALTAALVSCSPATSSDDRRTSIPNSSGNDAFAPYIPSKAADAEVTRAKERLIRECLEGYGFHPTGEVIDTNQGAVHLALDAPDTSYRSESVTREFGFHRTPQAVGETQEKVDFSPSMLLAINGSRSDAIVKVHGRAVDRYGCAGKADEALSHGIDLNIRHVFPGAEADAVNVILSAKAEAHESIKNDKKASSVNLAWSRCLTKKAGRHGFVTPQALATDPQWQNTNRPDSTEIVLALSSRECQIDLQYRKVMSAVTERYERDSVRSHRKDLEAARNIFEGRVKNARCILSSGSSTECLQAKQ